MNFDSKMIKPSFFNDTTTKNTNTLSQQLWLTEEQFQKLFKTTFTKIDKGKALYTGIMCKQDSNGEINDYYFKLYDKYLVQYERQQRQKIIGIMDLLFVKLRQQQGDELLNQREDKIQIQEDKLNDSDCQLPFFLFSRAQSYDILIPTTFKSFLEWERLLRSQCILTNFGTQYKNIKIIGEGTYSKVMLSQRQFDGKEFAVKIYEKAKITKAENIQNEVRIMKQLNHKNIIHLHEVYEGEYYIYLVTDLLTGDELFTKLHNIENYSESNACLILQNILEALHYLHSKGIMHRDLKPENLILKDQNTETEVIVADFGLSEKQKKYESLIFKKCGTPGYVAPEILNNKPYNTQVDIFSAGIILYVLLTGYAPFYGNSNEEILDRNKQCNIFFEFEKIDIKLSPEALDLLKSMLKEDPKERLTAQQALQHPWFTKFLVNKDKNTLKLPVLGHQIIKDESLLSIKSDKKHEQFLYYNELIVNSQIYKKKSPFSIDSQRALMKTPDQIKNQEKQCITEIYKDIIGKIVENNNNKLEKSINQRYNLKKFTNNNTCYQLALKGQH